MDGPQNSGHKINTIIRGFNLYLKNGFTRSLTFYFYTGVQSMFGYNDKVHCTSTHNVCTYIYCMNDSSKYLIKIVED